MDEQGLPRLCIACDAVLQNQMAFEVCAYIYAESPRLSMLDCLSYIVAEPFGRPTDIHMQDILWEVKG